MLYPATLTPHNDGSGLYDVTFVDLPGCVSQGNNLEHALLMAQEALTLHISTMLEDGDPLPPPSTLAEAQSKDQQEAQAEGYPTAPGTLYQLIAVTRQQKAEKESAPVRLSISLKPVVLEQIDKMAEEMGLTRSGLIAVATRDYIQRMQV